MSSFRMEIRNSINQQPEQISNGVTQLVTQSLSQSDYQIQSSTLQSRAKNLLGLSAVRKKENGEGPI